MQLGLEGKVAIVTGGARGIGGAIVEGYVSEKANVVIGDIMLDKAQELAQKLTRGGVKVIAVRTDVSRKSDVDNLVSATLAEFDRVDILV
ncbi:MAG: SDR family NAD(P)-dependent oxidoreductase, partial [Dehalococcoidales bacterium]